LFERQVYGSHIKATSVAKPVPYSSSGEKLSLQVVWRFETQAERSNVFGLPEEATYEGSGDQMRSPGLYVELDPWNYHFFDCLRANKTE
jgi:hypothetical protein